MSILPVEAVGALEAMAAQQASASLTTAHHNTSFASLLTDGVGQVNRRLVDAEAMATAFAVDDSIPLHQVTYALEQARMSFELMMQVRNRLTDAYQEIMRMQL